MHQISVSYSLPATALRTLIGLPASAYPRQTNVKMTRRRAGARGRP